MTYFDHTRQHEPHQPAFRPPERPDVAYPVDEDDDRIYTEEDYALAPDGDAFLEDEAEDGYPPADAPVQPFSYAGSYDTADGSLLEDEEALWDEDPLSEELLTEEERQELRRSTWQLIAGLGDFAGVILGTAAILVLIALLVSLINWLASDISQTFTLWPMRI